jgi:hypothetical protein
VLSVIHPDSSADASQQAQKMLAIQLHTLQQSDVQHVSSVLCSAVLLQELP